MRSVVLAVTGLALAALALAPPAHAHDALVSSSPADGEVLTLPPTQLVLTMSSEPLAVGSAVTVTGADGAEQVTAITVSGVTVVADLAALPDGPYAVAWRVVSGDGHPITGTLTFTVDAPDPPPPAPAPGPDASGSGATTGTPSASAEPPEPPEPGDSPDQGSDPAALTDPATASDPADGAGSRVTRTLVVGGAGALGAALVTWAVLALRRRHPRPVEEP